ncbi:MAG: hypothetical protein HQL29_05875, partial [Candidatus Omnitrophica bacterium]|nr:hypothetical protein [Candidatus Omnitrophota bacterium]
DTEKISPEALAKELETEFERLKNFLAMITQDSAQIEEKLNSVDDIMNIFSDFILSIKPVNWGDIPAWEQSMKDIATSV